MSYGKFITAINCIDGRTQEPLIRWAKTKFGIDFVDMINEPGPDKILLIENEELLNYILKRLKFPLINTVQIDL